MRCAQAYNLSEFLVISFDTVHSTIRLAILPFCLLFSGYCINFNVESPCLLPLNRLVLGGFFPGLSKRFLYIYPTIANDHRSGNKSYHLFGQSGALELP